MVDALSPTTFLQLGIYQTAHMLQLIVTLFERTDFVRNISLVCEYNVLPFGIM